MEERKEKEDMEEIKIDSEYIAHRHLMPQFREADEDGLVGLRGYMNYFQDVGSHYLHTMKKGNDSLIEEYGRAWIYTKYKFCIHKKADFSDNGLDFETWIEKERSPAVLHQNLVISRGEEVFALGQVEMCVLNLESQRLCKIQEIEFPCEHLVERKLELPPYKRYPKHMEGMEKGMDYKVRYCDLDKSRHMNNLAYIRAILDLFDSAFYQKHWIKEFEIHYVRQSYEGETLQLMYRKEDNDIQVNIIKEDGEMAVQASMKVEQI